MKKVLSNQQIFQLGLTICVLGLLTNTLISVLPINYAIELGIFDLLNLTFDWQGDEYFHLNYTELCLFLYLFIGLIQYRKRGLDSSGILKFCFSIIYVSNIISLVYFFIWNIDVTIRIISDPSITIAGGGSLNPVTYYFKSIIFFTSRLLVLWILLRVRKSLFVIDNEVFNKKYENIESLDLKDKTVELGTRFGHRILDMFLAFMMLNSFVCSLFSIVIRLVDGGYSQLTLSQVMTNSIGLQLLIFCSALVYYLMFALIFKSTATKFLSRSIVLDTRSKRIPSNRTMLKRAFARFIPFEAFFFLGGKHNGLHDTISNTTVARLGYDTEGLSKHWTFIIIFLISPAIGFIIDLIF